MEQSPSETSFEELKALYKETYDNLRWVMAINSVLLQEAGGAAEINRETLESIDLNKTRVEITYDVERDVYKVEGVYNDAV